MNKRDLYRLHLVLIAAAVMTTTSSWAADVAWTDGGGDNQWTTAANWNGLGSGTGGVPGNGDNVTIGPGFTVNVTNDLTAGGTIAFALLNLGNDTTTLNIQSSGVITATAQFSTWPKGTVNIEGRFNCNHATYAGGGTVTVSGNGMLTTDGALGFITPSGAALTIALTGSAASIGPMYQLGDFGGTGPISFVLTPDSGGINPINVTADLFLGNPTSNALTVDVDGYLGARTVVLFTYGNGKLTDDFETVNITRTGVGNLSLGSDPGGDPANLGVNEYYLDYGATAITLYYNDGNPTPPVAHYSLSANLNDDSGYGNNGTFQGTGGANAAATFVSDSKFGSVLSFDGTDDRISLGNVHTFQNNSWSVSMWVKTPATANMVPLLGKNDGDTVFEQGERLFEITSSGSWGPLFDPEPAGNFALLGWGMGGQVTYQSAITIDDGTWHMLTAVHDNAVSATDMTLYIDGVAQPAGSQTHNNNTYADVGGFYLGFSNYSSGGSNAGYFTGQMAEVNFYNVAMDAADVTALYDAFIRGTVISVR